jgi:SAM-dependent methyltransferase
VASSAPDSELKARHRAMWASGDYPSMVETFLLPLGPRLVKACDIGPGTRVLDVAAGTGNASIPAAQRGADVTASDLTPELLDAGRRRAQAAGVQLEWVQADAERLPFADASFEVVMSSIGAMFAPRHPDVADELVRSCRPSGRIGLLSWTPEGMIGALFRTMGPFAPPPPPGAQPPPLWGSDEHLRALFGDRVQWRTLDRDVLEVTAFERPRDYGEHFKARYGPTIAARANAVRTGREAEFDVRPGPILRRLEPRHPRPRAVRDGVPARGGHTDLTIPSPRPPSRGGSVPGAWSRRVLIRTMDVTAAPLGWVPGVARSIGRVSSGTTGRCRRLDSQRRCEGWPGCLSPVQLCWRLELAPRSLRSAWHRNAVEATSGR